MNFFSDINLETFNILVQPRDVFYDLRVDPIVYDAFNQVRSFLPYDLDLSKIVFVSGEVSPYDCSYIEGIDSKAQYKKLFIHTKNATFHDLKHSILHELRHAYQHQKKILVSKLVNGKQIDYWMNTPYESDFSAPPEIYGQYPWEMDANGFSMQCIGDYGLSDKYKPFVKYGKVLF